MSTLNINIDNHGQEYTVSEMRRRLAQVLAKLDGDQKVTFAFRAELADYQHVPVVPPTLKSPAGYPPVGGILVESAVEGELARPENN